jgi:tetratricopeptide (TPR) repeat protein
VSSNSLFADRCQSAGYGKTASATASAANPIKSFTYERTDVTSRKKYRTLPPATNRAATAPKPTSLDRPPWRAWVVAAVLAVAIGAVYGPALNAPFIFDDVDTITRNESITTLWPLIGTDAHRGPLNARPNVPTAARPLVNLSFAINYKFGQLNPVGYHTVNAIIHFLSAMLLWAIVRRTLRLPYFGGRFERAADWLAFAVAILWAIHPLQTETVIYATQRTELMMALFYLATLYCSLRYWLAFPLPFREGLGEGSLQIAQNRNHRIIWLTLATLACVAGMASKEVMVSAPLIVLLFDRTFISGSLFAALRKSWPLYVALAATWIPLVILSMGSPHGGAAGFNLGAPVFVWWFTQAKILWLYLKLAIWPSPLLIHYQLPYVTTTLEVCLYGLTLVLLGLGILVLLWRNHPVGFLGTCIFAILAPTSIIPVVTEMAAERRMYLPLAALIILFVIGGYWLAQAILVQRSGKQMAAPAFRPLTIAIPMLVIAIICGVASAKRLEVYQRPFDLWQQVLRYQPENDTAHGAIGNYLDIAGDLPGAIEHFGEAVRIRPDLAQSRFNLGVVLYRSNAFNKAAAQFAEGARLSPTDERMPGNLAGALALAGRNEEALVAIRTALQLSPDDWTFHNNKGEILKNLGRHQEAIEAYQQALRLNPGALMIYGEIADNYFKINQPENAMATLQLGLQQATAQGDRKKVEEFTNRIRDKH